MMARLPFASAPVISGTPHFSLVARQSRAAARQTPGTAPRASPQDGGAFPRIALATRVRYTYRGIGE